MDGSASAFSAWHTDCKLPACFAAGNFPIGLTSSGTPTSLQFVGPPGHDSTILSLLLAVETLFGDFPAPPNPSVCSGCVSNVTTQQVTCMQILAPQI